MKNLDFGIYGAYFASPRTIVSIIIPLSSLLLFYLIFRRTRSTRSRSWSLALMLFSSIFVWIFLGVSLILCSAVSQAYESHIEATVAEVFGRSLLIAVAAGLPFALFLRQVSPKIILRKARTLTVPQPEIVKSFESLRGQMNVPAAVLRLSATNAPISFAVDTKPPVIVMSERLLYLLKKDELEAVMAHELAHIKNSDTSLKALVTAYKTALPHDPLIRLLEPAFHREREMVADETAANVTNRPLSLASALLKIYEAFPKSNLRSYGTLSILGAGTSLMSRHPPILHRINRLIHLSEEFRQSEI